MRVVVTKVGVTIYMSTLDATRLAVPLSPGALRAVVNELLWRLREACKDVETISPNVEQSTSPKRLP